MKCAHSLRLVNWWVVASGKVGCPEITQNRTTSSKYRTKALTPMVIANRGSRIIHRGEFFQLGEVVVREIGIFLSQISIDDSFLIATVSTVTIFNHCVFTIS